MKKIKATADSKRLGSVSGYDPEIGIGMVSVLPEHGVRLTTYGGGVTQQELIRFATLFRETWTRVPLTVRRKVIGHVKRWPGWHMELITDWNERKRDTYSSYLHLGGTLRFWAPAVQAMPDETVRCLIAHGLCHVYVCIEAGNEWQVLPDSIPLADRECMVHVTIADWGNQKQNRFDLSRDLQGWVRDNERHLHRLERAARKNRTDAA